MISPSKLSLNTSINMDDFHPNSPISNMPFDELIELRNSDYISDFIEDDDNNDFTEILPPPPIPEEIGKKTYKNVYYDDAMEIEEVIKEDMKYIKNLYNLNDKKLFINGVNLGDGKMEYIKNDYTREMCINAWQAITLTNNWHFVFKDINSFMCSSNPQIFEISNKMEELGYYGHSGSSFGITMRNMQFLAQNGEEEFKILFEKS
jgi:hypothetical protein